MKTNVKTHLSDFTTDHRVLSLSAMAMFVGAASAVVAYYLVLLINWFTNIAFYQRFSFAAASPAGNHLGTWVILVPAVGGLIIGLMARYGSEKIRGHGIPEALEAILISRSRVEPKIAILKPLSSAISIGTGGPFGAEGPIIMTGGALGSILGQCFHLSASERKTLLAAGSAAGMAAIFGTPVAAAFLSIELLLFEWRPRSYIPVALASAVAGALRVPLLGPGPIFGVLPHQPLGIVGLLFCAIAGLIAGGAAGLLTALVYWWEDLFPKLRIHWMWWPTVGGLFVGLGGLIDPRILGVGYDFIHQMLRGDMLPVAAISLLVGKALIWSLALGSGTSGGVLAPLLMMGCGLGIIESHYIPAGDASLWAAVSMGAMMAGTMRVPFTAMVFTIELTHDLNTLPALLIACICSSAVTVLLLKRSILTEKVARRGYHITREYSIDPFERHCVEEIMEIAQPLQSDMTVLTLSELAADGSHTFNSFQSAPIVDAKGRLSGVITQGDVLRALQVEDGAEMTILDAGSRNLIVAYPGEVVREAAVKMMRNDIGRLPVVERANVHVLLGYITRSSIMSARMRWYEEEHTRDAGWMRPATT